MRFWMIGCGVVVVIIIGLGVFFGNIFFRQVEESKGKESEASLLYTRLEKDFPFEQTWGRALTEQDLAKFVACRREVLRGIETQIQVLEDEELSFFEKLTRSMDMFPSLAQIHSQALQQQEMSARAYYWIMNQVLLALRFAENDEAPAELKKLRKLLDRPRESGDDMVYETGPFGSVYFADPAAVTQWNLLPQVEPWQIQMPPESFQAVISQAQGLEETMQVFFRFDLDFKMICTQIFHDAAASPGDNLPREERPAQMPEKDK
jgi:hypothetical protein